MHNLLRQKKGRLKKLAVAVFLLIAAQEAGAQLRDYLNLPDHDSKSYYLGIALIYNSSRLNVSQHPMFLQGDSIMVVEPENTGGFGLSGMHNFRIADHLEFRIATQLMFSYKNLTYHLAHPDPAKEEQAVVTKQIESILAGVPVHLKFTSDRINNFRVYMFGGFKLEYDLASNSTARRADDLVKLKKSDFGVEAGIGFNFYFPSFIFSPEIKISNGLSNLHSRDESLKYSSALDRILSRMIIFSIHLEG